MAWAISIGAQFGLEGFQVESEEFILLEHFHLVVVERVAEQAVGAGVVVAFGCFIIERVVVKFVHVVASLTILPTSIVTSFWHPQRSDGQYANPSPR